MILVLFHSTHAVINAEKICTKHGIKAKVIPVPRSISSDCGMSLQIANDQEKKVCQLLSSNHLEFEIYNQEEI